MCFVVLSQRFIGPQVETNLSLLIQLISTFGRHPCHEKLSVCCVASTIFGPQVETNHIFIDLISLYLWTHPSSETRCLSLRILTERSGINAGALCEV